MNRTKRNDKNEKHYRELRWKHFFRLFITYVAPLIILTFFFRYQYKSLQDESRSLHMKSIAENLSNTLDLFLRERVVNLINIIDDPRISIPPTSSVMHSYLEKLKRDSDTFIDIGFFDSTGVQTAYAGPLTGLENRDYSHEQWYTTLKKQKERFIITDNYLGFRNQPHFTIAIKRLIKDKCLMLRATLDPKKLYEFISSQENPDEVFISVLNSNGVYQVVTPIVGSVLENSSILPPDSTNLGVQDVALNNGNEYYAFAWLNNAKWAVIVQKNSDEESSTSFNLQTSILGFSAILIFLIIVIIIIRTKKLVQYEKEKDIADAQLEQAAKLASIGELSSGIAHEINNPLAIIASEVGLMKDLMDPEFSTNTTFNDLDPHIQNIRDATFRCRDITGKLLSFVRKGDIELKHHNVHSLLNEIVDDLLGHEMYVSNIEIIKKYCDGMPEILTDGNQLKQVFLNIINNAADAITPPGKIIISTSIGANSINIEIADTGKGISQENVDKIFLPFFTTKEVGKGTGLGLSVSYGIIKNLGGKIEVKSILGIGTTFTISLHQKLTILIKE
jgi:two-component system NtrC family sensor kinase